MPEPEDRPYFPTDDDRAWMRKRMDDTGIGVQQLAEAVKVSRQAIYYILNGSTHSTTEWSGIVEKLGGTPPSGEPVVVDARLRKIMKKWPTLSEADKQMVEQLTERLGLKKP
jgi:predicted transcriptional regulator